MHRDNSIIKRKLLILAGADVHCKVVYAARELGIYVIVTDYLQPEDSPAKQIADEYWMLDIMDVDEIVGKCRAESVDGVLAYCIDPAQIPYQQICEKLGVPCYGTREQFEIMTDKRRFKDFCRQYDLDVVPEYTEEDVENNRVFYPVLVKPSDSRGSRGQTVCSSKEGIPGAIAFARSESGNGGVLMERYMLGKQDFSLAYIVIDSVPYILKIGDRYLGRAADNLERQHICTLLPSRSAEGYIELIEPKVRNMIKGLEITFGAVFLQGFIEDDKVYFYDPGLRFPGGDFDIVLKHATGFDAMKSMVRFALTGDITSCYGKPEGAYKLNGGICMILSIASRPGTIKVFDGLDEIAKDPRVFSISRRYPAGGTVPGTGDLKQRIAELVAYFPDRSDAESFVGYVYDALSVLDEHGQDMVVSRMGMDIPFGNESVIRLD